MNANNWGAFDPWGNAAWPPLGRPAWDYYRWNGGWGYLRFTDLGLYYIHGRWYNPDTGMFLSPNEKGDYIYGGDEQDAVNFGFINLALPPFPGGCGPSMDNTPCRSGPVGGGGGGGLVGLLKAIWQRIVGGGAVAASLRPDWVKDANSMVSWAKQFESRYKLYKYIPTKDEVDALVKAAREFGVKIGRDVTKPIDPGHPRTPWDFPHINFGDIGAHVPVPLGYQLPP